MPPKTKKYCCMCSNFRGKLVENKVITLHKFPANDRIRKVWLTRCKLVMKTFKQTKNSLLCSDHFADKSGPSPSNTIPSTFGNKTFRSTKIDENQMPVQEQEIINAVEDSVICDVNDTPFFASESILDSSIRLHDYCAELPTPNSDIRHQFVQTSSYIIDVGTQTDETLISHSIDCASQTEHQQVSVDCQADLPILTFEDIKHDDQKVSFYTGIPDCVTFETLFDEIKADAEERTGRKTPGIAGGRPRSLRLIDEFLLLLMRLRLGLLLEDLACRFRISTTACGTIVNKWIDYLDNQLSFLITWTSREVIDANMPDVFREKFPQTRIIIDCTEIRTETPNSLQLKSLMYSDYKSHTTWKSLVGISPSGVVTFVSDLWCGSISDKKITMKCGLVEMCEPGDAIMADKGFTIADLTTPRGVSLIIPPFKRKKAQMPKRDVKRTQDIANARIHVERQMERIKNFRILQGVMQITMAQRASKVWKICVRLTNLQPALVPMRRKPKLVKK